MEAKKGAKKPVEKEAELQEDNNRSLNCYVEEYHRNEDGSPVVVKGLLSRVHRLECQVEKQQALLNEVIDYVYSEKDK